LSAQSNPQGVPKELLEAKKLELIQEKVIMTAQNLRHNGLHKHRLKLKKRPRNLESEEMTNSVGNARLTISEIENAVIEVAEVAEEIPGEAVEEIEILTEEPGVDLSDAHSVIRDPHLVGEIQGTEIHIERPLGIPMCLVIAAGQGGMIEEGDLHPSLVHQLLQDQSQCLVHHHVDDASLLPDHALLLGIGIGLVIE
jgi:hypothetical protein